MSGTNLNDVMSASVRWPIISVLALLWGLTAALAWLLSRIAGVHLTAAGWCLDAIEALRAA